MEEQIQQKLKEVKNKIVTNSKDAHFANSLIEELVSLQKQADVVPTEIFIPVSDIEKSHDFGATKLSKTVNGKFIFEAKGGLYTIVDIRLQSLYTLCQSIFDAMNNPPEDETLRDISKDYATAVSYIFQAPIFCSLNDNVLLDVATALLQSFQKNVQSVLAKDLQPEKESDVAANIVLDNAAKVLEDTSKNINHEDS